MLDDIRLLQRDIVDWGKAKGWHDPELSKPVNGDIPSTPQEALLASIALKHMELSALVERIRKAESAPVQIDIASSSIPPTPFPGGAAYDFNVIKVMAKMALVHSEDSEGVESILKGELKMFRGPDGKPEGLVSEIADSIIRLLHLAGMLELDVATAIEAKMIYNWSRPYKHGLPNSP